MNKIALHDDFLDALSIDGVAYLDNVLPHLYPLLKRESGLLDYQKSMVAAGNYPAIRGDHIRWIDKGCTQGMVFLGAIDDFIDQINRALYLGIREHEAHYACYPEGFGYDWHTDNPKGKDARVLSLVYYLNDDYIDAHGGALEVVDLHQNHQIITPKAMRLAVFFSHLKHKVHTAHAPRFSIATWLRRDGVI